MKLKILKLSLIILLFGFTSTGCQKDDFFELNNGDKNAVIQKEVNDIEFKFCLLNEVGEASTIFDEGENFTFLFSFRNLRNDTIFVSTEFVYNEFFRVCQTIEDKLVDKGKPWTGIWCDFSLAPQEFIIPKTETGMISIPWLVDHGTMTYSPLCSFQAKKEPLSIGMYQTSFDLDFHYKINGKERSIKDITFKINFEIK